MLRKLLDKIHNALKAIPALGVVRSMDYVAKGVVERTYKPFCVLVDYSAIEQVIALNQSDWDAAVARALKYRFTNKVWDRGVMVPRSYRVFYGNRVEERDAYTVKVEKDGEIVFLTFRPGDLKQAIDYGLKVSARHRFRVGKFKKFIRKVGLSMFRS